MTPQKKIHDRGNRSSIECNSVLFKSMFRNKVDLFLLWRGSFQLSELVGHKSREGLFRALYTVQDTSHYLFLAVRRKKDFPEEITELGPCNNVCIKNGEPFLWFLCQKTWQLKKNLGIGQVGRQLACGEQVTFLRETLSVVIPCNGTWPGGTWLYGVELAIGGSCVCGAEGMSSPGSPQRLRMFCCNLRESLRHCCSTDTSACRISTWVDSQQHTVITSVSVWEQNLVMSKSGQS